MASAWAIVVSLALLLAGRTADAQVVDDCPAKSGEVFRIGLLNPVPEFTVSTLLAVEDVNVNAFAGMPTLGCFPFNLTLIRDEGPADEVCLDDPDFPYGEESDYGATECEPSSICFPRNMIWQNTMCSGSLGAPAAEAMLADGVMAIVGPHCSDVAMSVHDTLRAGNVPYISWATSSKLSDETAYPYHFRTAGPDGAQARAMVDIALQLNATSASILSDTSSISQTFAEDIIDILNPIDGFELRAHQVINFEENNPSRADEPLPDYVAAITALADAEADVTFAVYRPYLDSYCRNAREVLEASGDQDYETTWIHSDYLSYPTCVPDGFEGQILATKPSEGFGPAAGRIVYLWDQIAEENCWRTNLYVWSSAVYDGVLAIAVAIRNILEDGRRVDGDAIIEQWNDPNFEFLGASGNVRFGADGDSVRSYTFGSNDNPRLYDVLLFTNGSFSPVGSWDPLSQTEEGIISFTVTP